MTVSAAEDSVILDDVVITATRVPRPRADVPAWVSRIDEWQIRHSAASNVDDLLREASGVTVLRSYGVGDGIPSQINSLKLISINISLPQVVPGNLPP